MFKSTIIYDTLVRAGVECTSVFVPEPSAKASAVKPGSAIAVCSRNVKIVADCVLGDENTPVGRVNLPSSPRWISL